MFEKNFEIVKNAPPPMDWREYKKVTLDEWARLLSSDEFKEEKHFQHFFEQHPCMLSGAYGLLPSPDVFPSALVSKPILPDFTRKIPDFLWLTFNSVNLYPILIEIESPRKQWFTKKGTPTAGLTQAHDQLKEWKTWFSKPRNAASFADYYRLPAGLRGLVFEMPLPSKAQDPLLSWASKRKAATAVSLEIRLGAEETFQKALAELDAYTFLFLRNARYISVYLENTGEPNKLLEFERNIPRPEDKAAIRKGHVKITYHDREAWAAICGIKPEDLNNESENWWFYRRPIARTDFEAALEGLPERWHEIRQIEIELAVPITADNDAGRFAIYLPTKAKTGTGTWVNAPFYGKIDRTGIDWDRAWNSCLLNHTVACVGGMVNILRQSTEVDVDGDVGSKTT